ncbi:hypothetical protein AYO21_10146 [Fonsecaea monophora]|uniref:Uncharacterized protein n=1 Tax=Fonsecaea monophora TaxID=254056 RepID=A0A177EUH2_9EURO|nr:hypothetical protein AYO21_10146 [Fonsecaea monophora]KAH0846501.1 hypothetical protein FOPE_11915 [Fonsecaea pedrosoi]OAG35675.1 hypothetical protein AYO21_10146 [Fonsecaea monophora]
MAQPRGFTIFARAWTASPPRKTYIQSIPSLPRSEDEESIDSLSSGEGTYTPGSMLSTMTTVSVTSTPSATDVATVKPPTRGKVDFSALEDIFSQVSTTEPSPTSSSSSSSSSLWYILTTALLLAFHKEKLIGELWGYLSSSSSSTRNGSPQEDADAAETETEELVAVARRIREACLKASTLVGFPRAINALLALQQAIEKTHPTVSAVLETDQSLRAAVTAATESEDGTQRDATTTTTTTTTKSARGMALFSRIYAQHTPRVLSAMSRCSGGDLTHFAIHCIYGELLSDASVIDDLATGLLEFVCCLADGCGPQAKGHFFGSVNLGASGALLRAAVDLADRVAGVVGVERPWVDHRHGDGGWGGEGEDGQSESERDSERSEWKFLERVMLD